MNEKQKDESGIFQGAVDKYTDEFMSLYPEHEEEEKHFRESLESLKLFFWSSSDRIFECDERSGFGMVLSEKTMLATKKSVVLVLNHNNERKVFLGTSGFADNIEVSVFLVFLIIKLKYLNYSDLRVIVSQITKSNKSIYDAVLEQSREAIQLIH